MSDNFAQTSDRMDPEELYALARDKGFVAERALRPHLWRLIRADGTPALEPTSHDTGFTYFDAIDFLNKEPAERYS
jgi:hypothetical protein